MTRMTTGTAVVETLLQHGVDTVFGLPGVQIYEYFDALQRAGDRVSVYTTRHEQAAAYMAFGYAQSTGRVGTYMVVPGPGVLNTTAALCTAYGTNTPVFCVTGQVPAAFIGSGRGELHELPDQLGVLRSLTKWAERIDHPAQAPSLVAEGFRQLRSGRVRPVAVETPWDVCGMEGEVTLVEPLEPYPAIEPDPGCRGPCGTTAGGCQESNDHARRRRDKCGRGGRSVSSDLASAGHLVALRTRHCQRRSRTRHVVPGGA